jgi:hypothetical protein
MGFDSQKADKPLPKTEPTEGMKRTATQDLGGSLLSSGDTAARNYGKGANLGDLPTTNDLLNQINHDEKAGVKGFDRLPFNKERELVKKLSPEDLQNIGALVDSLKHHKTAAAGSDGDNLGDAVKRFQKDPNHLVALKDALQLELERQKIDKQYQINVMGYKEKTGTDAAVLVVSKTKEQSSFGITTDGKKAPDELLKFLYD